MEVKLFPIVYHYGDTFEGLTVQWIADDGNPHDLTNYRTDMKIRDKVTGDTVLHLSSDTGEGLTIPDPTDGTVIVNGFPSIMTSGSLVQGESYKYDLQVKSQDGSVVKTLIKGEFRVDPEQTDV